MSHPLLYVTFKKYPELGRLKVVKDGRYLDCSSCAFDVLGCAGIRCSSFHYEKADERKAKP